MEGSKKLDGLLGFQQALREGMEVLKLDSEFVLRYDKIPEGIRFSFAKVVNNEVLSLATFGQEDSINGLLCFSINYSVAEEHRRKGLAVEIVLRGIEELKKEFLKSNTKSFYLDAIIEISNGPSLKVAEKIFQNKGRSTNDYFSGLPSVYFQKKIVI